MATVTDDLGRTITVAIDQSTLLQQLKNAMSSKLGAPQPYAKGKTAEDLLEKMPQEIYKEFEKKFKKDFEATSKYIKQISDYLTKKPSGKAKDSSKALMDQSKTMIDHLGIISSGMGILISHVAAINKSSGMMANLFGSKGSGYVHDIHCQAILLDIQRDLRKGAGGTTVAGTAAETDAFIEAVKNSGMVEVKKFGKESSSTPGSIPTEAISGEVEKQKTIFEQLTESLKEQVPLADHIQHNLTVMTINWAKSGEFTERQLKRTTEMLINSDRLENHQKEELKILFRKIQLEPKVEEHYKNLIKFQEKLNIEEASQGKFIEQYSGELKRLLAYQASGFTNHITAGVDIKKLTEGIGAEQVKNTTSIRESLYITQGLTKESDNLRNAYLDASRAAENVKITGQDALEVQKAWRKNLQSGIGDLKNLNRITQTGLNLASLIKSNAESTADTFAKWHLETGMSTNQMAQFSRHVQFAGKMTGVTGEALLQAVNSARELADAMRDAGTLTASAAGQFVQYAAAMNKLGSSKATLPILKALSSTVALYNEASSATQSLLFQAAGSVGKIRELQSGTIMDNGENQRAMTQGIEKTLNQFTKQFGLSITDDISKFSDQQKMQLNMQLQSAYGIQLGEAQRLVQTLKEGSMTFEERLKGINDKLSQNLTQQERNVLLEQKRQMELQSALKGLTKLDEVAKVGKSMAESMSSAGMSQEEVRKNLNQAITSVNESLIKAGKGGELIDAKKIESALSDPSQYRELLAGINAAEQKAELANKEAQDPALQAQQKIRELNAQISENTGKLLQVVTGALGSGGLIVTALAGLVTSSSSGSTAIQNFIANFRKGGGEISGLAGAVGAGSPGETVSKLAEATKETVSSLEGLDFFAKKSAKSIKEPTTALADVSKIAPTTSLNLRGVGMSLKSMVMSAGPFLLIGLGLVVLFKAFEKAFEKTGGGLSSLTTMFENLMDVFGSILDVFAELLSVVLVPVVQVLKVVIDQLSTFFKTISEGVKGMLNSVGLGGIKKAETTNAGAGKEAGGTPPANKKGNIPNPSGPMGEVTTTAKDVETSVNNLPSSETMTKVNSKALLWLGGFAIIVAIWAVLAVKFGAAAISAAYAGFQLAAGILGLAASLVLVVAGMALAFDMLNKSFDYLEKVMMEFNNTIMGKLGYLLEAAVILGVFAGTFLLILWAFQAATTPLWLTLPAFQALGIGIAVFSLIGIAIGIIVGLMALGFDLMNKSFEYLKISVDTFNKNFSSYIVQFIEAFGILTLLSWAFIAVVSSLLTVTLPAQTALLSALGAVAIGVGIFSLIGIAIGAIVGLMALGFDLMNKAFAYLKETMEKFAKNSELNLALFVASFGLLTLFGTLFIGTAFLVGMAALAIWGSALPAVNAIGIGIGIISLLGIAIAGVVALMAVGFALMNSAFAYLNEVITEFSTKADRNIKLFQDAFGYIARFGWELIKASLQALVGVGLFILIFEYWIPALIVGLGVFLMIPFAISSMTDTMASGIFAMKESFKGLAKVTGDIDVEGDIRLFQGAFENIFRWVEGVADSIESSLKKLGWFRTNAIKRMSEKVDSGMAIAEIANKINALIDSLFGSSQRLTDIKEKIKNTKGSFDDIPTGEQFKEIWKAFETKINNFLTTVKEVKGQVQEFVNKTGLTWETDESGGVGKLFLSGDIKTASNIGSIIKQVTDRTIGIFGSIDTAVGGFNSKGGWKSKTLGSIRKIPSATDVQAVWNLFKKKMTDLLVNMASVNHWANEFENNQEIKNGLINAENVARVIDKTIKSTVGIFDKLDATKGLSKTKNWQGKTSKLISSIPSSSEFKLVWDEFQSKMGELLLAAKDIDAIKFETTNAENLVQLEKIGVVVEKVVNGVTSAFAKLDSNKLKGIGRKFNIETLNALPSGDDIKNMFGKISNLMKGLPGLNKDMAELQKMLDSGVGNADAFSTQFNILSGKLAIIFNKINTSLNEGMGKITNPGAGLGSMSFKDTLMKILPSKADLTNFDKMIVEFNAFLNRLIVSLEKMPADKLKTAFEKFAKPLGETTDKAIALGKLSASLTTASASKDTAVSTPGVKLAEAESEVARKIAETAPSASMVEMNKGLSEISTNTSNTVKELQEIKAILKQNKDAKNLAESIAKSNSNANLSSSPVLWGISKISGLSENASVQRG